MQHRLVYVSLHHDRCHTATMTKTTLKDRAPQRSALADPHLCRPFDGGQVERALPHQPGARSDRPVRSPSICRPRPATTAIIRWPSGEVGKVGVPISHLGDMRTLFDGIPLDRMNTSMTINAPAAWLLVSLYSGGRERRASSAPSCRARRRTTSSRNISQPRDLHLPARALAAADRRHDRLHLSRGSQVEPDERLQLSPAGSRRDADAGAGLFAGQRHRRARCGARARPGARGRLPAGGRAASPSS